MRWPHLKLGYVILLSNVSKYWMQNDNDNDEIWIKP